MARKRCTHTGTGRVDAKLAIEHETGLGLQCTEEGETWCQEKETCRRMQGGNCSSQRWAGVQHMCFLTRGHQQRSNSNKEMHSQQDWQIQAKLAIAYETGPGQQLRQGLEVVARKIDMQENAHGQAKNPYMAVSTTKRGGLRNPQNWDCPQLYRG
jgi:hypothetical protein